MAFLKKNWQLQKLPLQSPWLCRVNTQTRFTKTIPPSPVSLTIKYLTPAQTLFRAQNYPIEGKANARITASGVPN
jgi:hypothetical protein